MKNYAFVDANPAFNTHAQPGDIIVATNNFGGGGIVNYVRENGRFPGEE